MPVSDWKIIAASAAGTSHAAKNEACQDFYSWQTVVLKEELLIVVVSDGAGSAKKGGVGAKMTCEFFNREIKQFAENNNGIVEINQNTIGGWLRELQTQFAVLAAAENLTKSDFAATLLLAAIQKDAAIFAQIGDGAIVYAVDDAPNEFRLFTIPQQGEYANSTYFVTESTAFDVLKFEMVNAKISEIAIFTDGLQRVALNYQTNTPHAPFLSSMFAPLRKLSNHGNLEKQLTEFLDSPKINERTDDDKTLFLASRNR